MRFFFAAALFAVLCQGRFPFGSPSTPALETTALSSARLMFPISNFRYPSTRRAGTPVKQTFWGTAPRRPTLAVMNSLRGGMQLMVKTLDGKTVTVRIYARGCFLGCLANNREQGSFD